MKKNSITLLFATYLMLSSRESKKRENLSAVSKHIEDVVFPAPVAPINEVETVEEEQSSIPKSTPINRTTETRSTSSSHYSRDYFQMGYDDGYKDGCSLEKGRSYDNSLSGDPLVNIVKAILKDEQTVMSIMNI